LIFILLENIKKMIFISCPWLYASTIMVTVFAQFDLLLGKIC
jgi:hypothetical protein